MKQRDLLRDDCDRGAQAALRHCANVLAVDHNPAAIDVEEALHEADHSRFPCA